jgi:hypothetical protein
MRIMKFTQRMELFATRSSIAYGLMSLYYRMMVKKEVRLAGITRDDRVMCIGGGHCPYTAILIRKYTDARVTVIDNDCACIDRSKDYLYCMGLGDIEVRHCDGKHMCCRDYTVIHIAMQVTPKEAVLREMIGRAQCGARVLVRWPKAIVEGLYNGRAGGAQSEQSVRHGLFSNVGNTSVHVVEKGKANIPRAGMVAV